MASASLIVIAAALGVFLYYLCFRLAWIRTRQSPFWLKSLVRLLFVAFVITPSLGCGQGGCIPVPAIFVLIDALYKRDWSELFGLALVPFVVVWITMYLIAMGIVGMIALWKKI